LQSAKLMFFIDPSIVITPDYTSYITPVASRDWSARKKQRLKCKKQKAPVVKVKVREKPVVYNNRKTADELKGMASGAYSPYEAGAHTEVGGLTKGKLGFHRSSSIEQLRLGDDHCLWVSEITITVQSEPIVYIAKKNSTNKCRYKEVLAHEMKHVNVQRKIIMRYGPVIQRAVFQKAQQIGVVGPKKGRDVQRSADAMMAEIEKVVTNTIARLAKDRDTRQKHVDTKEEYAAVANALDRCGK